MKLGGILINIIVDETTYEGSVEKIIYKNKNNDYMVLLLKTDSEDITVVGVMPGVGVAENLRIQGNFSNHHTFGKQFVVKSFSRFLPQNNKSILKYLSSGVIKGIGPSRAKDIVEAFGEDSLNVIENHPEKLSTLKSITQKSAEKMSNIFKENFGLKEVITYLSKFEITALEAIRAFKKFGNKTLDMINENPYVLCGESICLDFNRIDNMFVSKKDSFDGLCRVRAFILHLLLLNSKSCGHTCLPKNKIIDACLSIIKEDNKTTNKALGELIDESAIRCYSMGEVDFLYLNEIFCYEEYISERISMMLKLPPQSIVNVGNLIDEIESNQGIKYAKKQKEAIKLALEKGMLILTGGPGTGKTTTLNAIIKILNKMGEKVVLTAPTGRAAQRMSEVTKAKAKTIHRLLEAEPNKEGKRNFRKNEKNLIKCDAVIIDELSMVDAFMFDGLLRALPISCRLILVGDEGQLPSVGCGNILADLIKSKRIPVIHLNEIFRQSSNSLIVTNAHRIVNGDELLLNASNRDFFFLDVYSAQDIKSTIMDLFTKRLPKTYNYLPLLDIQILCPGRKGVLGTFELNKSLQNVVNPSDENKSEIKIGDVLFREGDKVMQTKNNYDLTFDCSGSTRNGVFNGDIGILKNIDKMAQVADIEFEGCLVRYNMDQILEVSLAYATTVHKSQGSEFRAVIMPMFPGPEQLYYRKLLYTAITRARSLLILVGRKNVASSMIRNDRKTRRCSGLYHMLSDNVNMF
ncbi:MAG: ATP-dependent RecD-like DNA helicase [Oscillospiraceae bacterium]|jgi:exodeoxyribonuclease V alpha subunit|nr:ATP-dependent RecD-like DNA helicase [Oscillospiraceae bacterium]